MNLLICFEVIYYIYYYIKKKGNLMAGVNKVILLGRLGRDPEIKYTSDGTAVTNFSIATSEQWKDKNSGEKREKTEWHSIVAWRNLGEICGKYLFKGRQVYVEGRLETRSWEQDGVTKYKTEIIATDISFVGNKDTNIDNNEQSYPNAKEPYQGKQENDIPF